jgi:hypothetical protein
MTAKNNGQPWNLTRVANTMVISAMAEPGDKSMPPARMTIVEPIAMIATMET